MDLVKLSSQVEERYRRYLKTTFYFRDPDLRASFEEALSSGHLSKGPYLEATPVFKRGQTPRALFQSLVGFQPDEGFLKVVQDTTPLLYQHQEEAIQRVFDGRNVIVATGTGSGKTEAFLYPILIHLYREFQAGALCPGVRALILYPMNALANDQRKRLGEICKRLDEENSPFRFTFGQYIGETPEDENDSRGHARDHMADRSPGELAERDKEGDKIDFGVISLTTVSPGYMVVLCEGRRGNGFYVCGTCGFGDRKCKLPHKTPYGQDCLGTLDPLSLGHEFVTDVLQLQFHPTSEGGREPVWFAYSLAYAVVEGAGEVLEVPSTDLSATVAHSEQYPVPPIILYDNVPGGAGLVARLEEEEVLKDCLEAAQKRVSGNCGCDESTSCYGCLRGYRNQFAHQYLQRGPVMHYLEALLSKWK